MVRFWFVIAVSLAVAVAAVFVYQRFTNQPVAEATVSVLDPFASRGTASGEAQVDFSDIVQSRLLVKRVAAALGTKPDTISGKIKIRVLPPPAGAFANVSVLYGVSAQGKTESDAVRLDNEVVHQAIVLYLELNTPDPAMFEDANASRFQAAQAAIDKAQADLDAFGAQNHAADLPAQIAQQRDLVHQLDVSVSQAQASQAAAGNPSALVRYTASLQASLKTARARLDSLTKLETRYQQLTDQVVQARQVMQALVLAEQAYEAGGRPHYASEAKILDAAAIQSQKALLDCS
jgi:uncharacterized protein involved in exopolysaccharide biosynthesis